jgi:Domain of unknown function (DUF3806)
MEQEISELTEKEKEWLSLQLQVASAFVERFSPRDAGHPVSLAALDRAFAAWMATQPTEGDLINGTINGIGMAFGQTLVDGLGMQWVIASDDQGSEMAVYGLPGSADVLVYPANFVAKRWERREINFLQESYGLIARDVSRLAREHGLKSPSTI